MREWVAESAFVAGAELGEGPLWDVETSELLWLDILGRRLHRFDPIAGIDRALTLREGISAVGLRSEGGLVCAAWRGFGLLEETTGAVEILAPIELDRPDRRMNDGKVDPAGRFLAGTTTDKGVEGASALYRLEPGPSLTCVLSDVTESNGLDWSADGRRMYYVDTPTQRLDVFDVEPTSGELSGRRTLARFPEEHGMPDGLTVDAEGCIWLAFWDGAAVRRLSPDGEEIGIVRLPTSRPTSCAFGGPDLDQLFITTASSGLEGAEPQAGNLFVVNPGVTGRFPNRQVLS